jgi:hypothetical protein
METEMEVKILLTVLFEEEKEGLQNFFSTDHVKFNDIVRFYFHEISLPALDSLVSLAKLSFTRQCELHFPFYKQQC